MYFIGFLDPENVWFDTNIIIIAPTEEDMWYGVKVVIVCSHFENVNISEMKSGIICLFG